MSMVRARTIPVKPMRHATKPVRPFGEGVFPSPVVLDAAGNLTLVEDANFAQSSNPAEEYRFQVRSLGEAIFGFDSQASAELCFQMIRDGEMTMDGHLIERTAPKFIPTAEEWDELDRINRGNSFAALKPIRGGGPSDADWDCMAEESARRDRLERGLAGYMLPSDVAEYLSRTSLVG